MKKHSKKNSKKRKYTRKNRRKTVKKIKMKGGLITRDPNISYEQAILNMMNTPGAKLTPLEVKSTSGFIFVLTIPPENYQLYEEQLQNGPNINAIYSLLFKLIIIDDTESIRFEEKDLTTTVSFENEFKLQKEIYNKTNIIKGNNICPDAICSIIFENNENSEKNNKKKRKIHGTTNDIFESLVSLLQYDENSSVQSVIDQLTNKDVVNENLKLGMIVMEYADPDNYTLISKISDTQVYNNACEYAIAEIVILFVYCNIINYDCHFGNILANLRGNKPLLIDFGRTFYLNEISEEIKEKYHELINIKRINKTNYDDDFNEINDKSHEFDICLSNINITADIHKKREYENILKAYISKIITFIAFVDYSINNKYYKRNTPQMIDLLKFLHDKYVNNIYTVIYNPIDTDKLNNIMNCILKLRILHNPIYSSDSSSKNSIFSFYHDNDDNNMFARKK